MEKVLSCSFNVVHFWNTFWLFQQILFSKVVAIWNGKFWLFWHLTGMICKACSWLTFDCFSAIFPNLLCSKGEKTTPWRPLLASRPSMKCTSAWQNLAVHYLLDGRVVPLYSAANSVVDSLRFLTECPCKPQTGGEGPYLGFWWKLAGLTHPWVGSTSQKIFGLGSSLWAGQPHPFLSLLSKFKFHLVARILKSFWT